MEHISYNSMKCVDFKEYWKSGSFNGIYRRYVDALNYITYFVDRIYVIDGVEFMVRLCFDGYEFDTDNADDVFAHLENMVLYQIYRIDGSHRVLGIWKFINICGNKFIKSDLYSCGYNKFRISDEFSGFPVGIK